MRERAVASVGRLPERHEHQREHQRRERQQDVHDRDDERVGALALVAGEQAEKAADGDSENDRRGPDRERHPRAIDPAAEDVAPVDVGAHPMIERGRQLAVEHAAGAVRVDERQVVGEDREEDHGRQPAPRYPERDPTALLRLDIGLVERIGEDTQGHDLARGEIDRGPEERSVLGRWVERVAVTMRELLHGESSDR